ncbi:hypothetical protein [Brachybacterium hainanense]|uniref:DUF3592 domain-containing protein n=1 Tax=Brachybacterium hainanense TaxID=1541174 RepID=A0ABV6RBE4_9MICO
MKRAEIITALVWGVLSAWLGIWMIEKLFLPDQSRSILPLRDDTDLIAPLVIGVLWGFTSMILGVLAATRRNRAGLEDAQLAHAVGTVVETHDPGISHWDFDDRSHPVTFLIIQIDARDGGPLLGLLPVDGDLPDVGDTVPVRYAPGAPGVLYPAYEQVL